MDLFTAGAQWKTAASRTNVFKIYTGTLLNTSDYDLKQMFADLNSRGIALGLEFPPLTPSDTCGRGIEGFSGFFAQEAARRIKDNGGVLRYVAMDEPFYFGSLYNRTNACQWSAQQVAANAAANLAVLKKAFPGLVIGDIEPLPAHFPHGLERYAEWMDAFRAAAGYPLAFFHGDMQWHDPTWQVAAALLERAAHKRGIAFGMIYNGDPSDLNDIEWCRHAEERLTTFELEHGGPADQVIFQTWDRHPYYILPDTMAGTHTNLIVRYFRDRARLTAAKDGGGVSGHLTDSAGQPLAGATVFLTGTADRGQGLTGDYVLRGIAPPWANAAEMGFDLYTNCACSGPGEFTRYGFHFTSNGLRKNLLTAVGNFAKGLDGWTISVPGAAQVEAKALRVEPRGAKPLTLRSSPFPVVPGVPLTLRIRARIPPQSAHSGFFVLNFLPRQSEVVAYNSTLRSAFRPLRVELSSTVTKADGTFRLRVPHSRKNDLQLRVSFEGDETHWSAEAAAR